MYSHSQFLHLAILVISQLMANSLCIYLLSTTCQVQGTVINTEVEMNKRQGTCSLGGCSAEVTQTLTSNQTKG